MVKKVGKKGKAQGKWNNKTKLYLVRLICGRWDEPMEPHFEYIYARNEREAEESALELYENSGYICESVQASEISKEWKEEFERERAKRWREALKFVSKYGREDEPLYEPDPDE